ncbi:MAG: hypothetical protein COX37_00980 [Candidatus Nealsonbacteria bacterium CG23_combo_of_CG06-09_8_20_14_all_39_17]|uniref:HIG1 domain-containing protein n=1 Tax=Candidatus Nealsonbacteria bacterium CG23_combo_of_CG06-09_8_20_14_all_39_17 TaxID=1974722 RepID=A0A2G9YUU6_9BACT|nr:MAG: hypothetical protein COX37_00980 [Candidatus Nealsonbacteria bacterium CG23_combo_of_CG06-09_8_20_14_all_39_17]
MEFNKKILITLALFIAFPFFVFAAQATNCTEYCTNPAGFSLPNNTVCPCSPLPSDSDTLIEFVNKIIDVVFTLAVVLMPLMVIVGASMMMLQGMSEDNIKKGKMIIRFSMIGFVIILLAKGIVAMVKQIIGG